MWNCNKIYSISFRKAEAEKQQKGAISIKFRENMQNNPIIQ